MAVAERNLAIIQAISPVVLPEDQRQISPEEAGNGRHRVIKDRRVFQRQKDGSMTGKVEILYQVEPEGESDRKENRFSVGRLGEFLSKRVNVLGLTSKDRQAYRRRMESLPTFSGEEEEFDPAFSRRPVERRAERGGTNTRKLEIAINKIQAKAKEKLEPYARVAKSLGFDEILSLLYQTLVDPSSSWGKPKVELSAGEIVFTDLEQTRQNCLVEKNILAGKESEPEGEEFQDKLEETERIFATIAPQRCALALRWPAKRETNGQKGPYNCLIFSLGLIPQGDKHEIEIFLKRQDLPHPKIQETDLLSGETKGSPTFSLFLPTADWEALSEGKFPEEELEGLREKIRKVVFQAANNLQAGKLIVEYLRPGEDLDVRPNSWETVSKTIICPGRELNELYFS